MPKSKYSIDEVLETSKRINEWKTNDDPFLILFGEYKLVKVED